MRTARADLAAGAPARALAECRIAIAAGAAEPELLRVAAEACLEQGDARSAELFNRAADATDDPQRLFELGSHLLSEEAADAARGLLARALSRAPLDVVIRSELALAQARLGRPAEAVETLALHPCLADDPGALFEFAWCSLLAGDATAAEGSRREIERLAERSSMVSMADAARVRVLVERLSAAIARARLGAAASPPDARDWLFVEHGALLLSRERLGDLVADDGWAGGLVGRAAVAFRALGLDAPRFVAADDASVPLADALAHATGGTRLDLGRGGAPASIVVARAAGDLERIASRLGPETHTFAAVLDWSRTAPRVPDFTGALARRLSWTATGIEPSAVDDAALTDFVAPRRDHLAPRAPRLPAAYVPDAPLPWPE